MVEPVNGQRPETVPALRRELGFWTLTAFGVGDILGAGIYALIGKVAAEARSWTWLSFLVTVVIAMLTAISYAQLGARFPRSGGEAYYCQRATGKVFASLLVGYLVFTSGLVSLATVSLAFSGYLCEAIAISEHWGRWFFVPSYLLAMSGIAFWGIRQSSRVNVVCTLVEATGLLFVIFVGVLHLWNVPQQIAQSITAESVDWSGVLSGSGLAFFAFIGFEDMVNVAEEVRRPKRDIPLSILAALSTSAVIYTGVACVATRVVPIDRLSQSAAPLLDVIRIAAPSVPAELFTGVALFAVANTGLLNLVMGSRLLYGMTTQGLLPESLAAIHPRTQTPHRSIAVMFLLALVLALSGSLTHLAGTTNFLLLLVFLAVNVSLFKIRGADNTRAFGHYATRGAAVLGSLTCAALILFLPIESLRMGGVLLSLGAGGIAIHVHRHRTDSAAH